MAMVVMAYHWNNSFKRTPALNFLTFAGGFSPVVVFFLISGFSIGHSITLNVRGFYTRRFNRIYPLYMIAVILAGLSYFLIGKEMGSLSFVTFVGNLLLLQQFGIDTIGSNLALWSLSIECACYALAVFFLKMNAKALGAIVAFSMTFFFFHNKFGLTEEIPVSNFAYMLGFWLIGFIWYRYGLIWPVRLLLIVTAVPLIFNARYDYYRYAWVWPVLFAFWALSMSALPRLSTRVVALFLFLGDLSYPLYLFHDPIFFICTYFLRWYHTWECFGVVMVFAVLSLFLVDFPYRKMVRRNALRHAPPNLAQTT